MADRFAIAPLLAAIVLVGLLLAFSYSALNFEKFDGLAILALLLSCIALLAGLVLLVVRLVRRQWRASMSLAVALALLVGCFFARFEVYFQIDRIRFQVFKEHYVGLLTGGIHSSTREPTAYRWGFWAHFTTGPIYRLLIHDPSDDILSQRELQSGKIRALLETEIEIFSVCKLSTRRLEGHFYSVVAAC